MPPSKSKDLHTLPISSRPPSFDPTQFILGSIWAVLFTFGCCMVHGAQLVLLVPLRIVVIVLPLPWLKRLHEAGVRWTKGAFGRLCVLICEWFAPTRVLITLEGDNLKDEEVIVKDEKGNVVGLNLPEKLVVMANHQIYADWLYLWCILYYAKLDKDVLILLKKSLKWVPVIGWGMQVYHFVFLARRWASDKLQLSDKLSALAARAQLLSTPLALMIFPEGTLVSRDTRPVSKKYAEKIGVADMDHMLLPRSTGLFYCLRSLSPQTPSLHLLDATIAYEGIPRGGIGQDYFTLRSIYLAGVPPPRIHLHLRLYNVRKDVPLGDVTEASGKDATKQLSRSQRAKDMDASPEEAAVFDNWVRTRWREKDALVERYLSTGTFEKHDGKALTVVETSTGKEEIYLSGTTSRTYELPLKLRSKLDIFEAFTWLTSIIIPYALWVLWKRLNN